MCLIVMINEMLVFYQILKLKFLDFIDGYKISLIERYYPLMDHTDS